MEVQRVHTGNDPLPTKSGWVLSRLAMVVRILMAAGMSAPNALKAAIDVVSHWARETGWGRAEWNYNPGNVKSYSDAQERYFLIDSTGSHDYYVSYPNLYEGALWTLQKASHGRYADAWRLVGQGEDWYAALMRAGWHPYTERGLNEFRDVRRRVVDILYTATAPQPSAPIFSSAWTPVAAVATGAVIAGAYLYSQRHP